MSETVLVGVDNSTPSRGALRWAAQRSEQTNARMHLVHVVDGDWARVGTRLARRMEQEALHLLEREANYVRALAPAVAASTEMRHGGVVQELVKASEHAGLSVMGTHKTGIISGRVFGSRSVAFGTAARSPAAIIPQPAVTVTHGQRSVRERQGIVVGVDNTPAGLSAIRLAAVEADRSGESLTLLRAYSLPRAARGSDDLFAEATATAELFAARLLSEAVDVARREHATLSVATRTVQSMTAEALIDASQTATLLVIGGADSTTWGTASMGQTVHDVLINVTAPTIVARPRPPQ